MDGENVRLVMLAITYSVNDKETKIFDSGLVPRVSEMSENVVYCPERPCDLFDLGFELGWIENEATQVAWTRAA